MTEVPKIVYDRLQGLQRTAQAHPDADLLAGFAERALSSDEREGILEHLALCGDCRDVVTLGLPADAVSASIEIETGTDQPVAIPAKAKNGWLIWPGLRWAALATGVAVAASVLLLHPGKLNQAMLPSEKHPATAIAQPAEHSQIAASSDGILTESVPDEATTSEAQPEPSDFPKKLKAGQAFARSPHPSFGTRTANNGKKSPDVSKLRMGKLPAAPVTGANGRTGETFATSAESALVAQNEAPAIEKAKQVPPAIQDQVSAQPASSQVSVAHMSARVAWSIAGGTLQRSVDRGQSWQSALHTDHPLFCYATRDEDVWAGGQAGILFHSSNGGLTWIQVRPSTNSQQLGSDITHLELRENSPSGKPSFPREIMVSTSNNEIWTSIDGGTTWDRK